jgi:hypothetical protein
MERGGIEIHWVERADFDQALKIVKSFPLE